MEETVNNHFGTGDIVEGDKIVHIYSNLDEYKELVARLETLQQMKAWVITRIEEGPKDEDHRHLHGLNNEIDIIKGRIESLKETVTRLSEMFDTIEINSERRKRAKEYFGQGKLDEAEAVLKEEEIDNDRRSLKQQLQKHLGKVALINRELENLAGEYLIKAQIQQTKYDDPDRFGRTCELFEKALDTARIFDVLWQYADFLQNFSEFDKAEELLEEALKALNDLAENDSETHLSKVAKTLHSLAVVHLKKQEFDAAVDILNREGRRICAVSKSTGICKGSYTKLPQNEAFCGMMDEIRNTIEHFDYMEHEGHFNHAHVAMTLCCPTK